MVGDRFYIVDKRKRLNDGKGLILCHIRKVESTAEEVEAPAAKESISEDILEEAKKMATKRDLSSIESQPECVWSERLPSSRLFRKITIIQRLPQEAETDKKVAKEETTVKYKKISLCKEKDLGSNCGRIFSRIQDYIAKNNIPNNGDYTELYQFILSQRRGSGL